MKALASSFLSLLMLATFLWGGCISCPQFFMFSGKTEKGCCKKNGRCERTSKNTPLKECRRMPLEPQVNSFGHGDIALAAITTDGAVVSPQAEVSATTPYSEIPLFTHSPPDLTLLYSTFLI